MSKTMQRPKTIEVFARLLQAAHEVMKQSPCVISADLYKWDPNVSIHLDDATAYHEFFAALDPDYGISPRKPYRDRQLLFTITARMDNATILAIMDEQDLCKHFPDQVDDLVAQWHVEYDEERPRDKDE